jgi:hypothetical protein
MGDANNAGEEPLPTVKRSLEYDALIKKIYNEEADSHRLLC